MVTESFLPPIRERLNEKLTELTALQTLAPLTTQAAAAAPGSTVLADYQTVLARLEVETLQALGAAALELRKPTISDLIDRLWNAGPLTFRQIQAAVVETAAPAGQIETLLNRLHNAGLLEASPGPTPATEVAQQRAITLPPTKLLPPEPQPEITRKIPLPDRGGDNVQAAPMDSDVTTTYSALVTTHGRAWFNERALANGIDLSERINCQF